DGFQHIQLERNLNLLLIDATDPFGEGWMVPLGRLREAVRGLQRADVIVMTRSDHPFDEEAITQVIRRYKPSVHLLFAYHDLIGLAPVADGLSRAFIEDSSDTLKDIRDSSGEPVIALSGIARPELFVQDITHFQIPIADQFRFPDHYAFTQADVDTILAAAHR